MKFRDGYWGIKEGVKHLNPAELRDVRGTDGTLSIFSSCKRIVNRGDTLNSPMLTTTFSSPMEDVVRVRTVHFKGAVGRGPFFDLAPDRSDCARIGEAEDAHVFSSGKLEVRVGKGGPWSVTFSRGGKALTGISAKLSGHFTAPDKATFMNEGLTLGVGENLYGLGERFTSFVKNGQVVDIWNEDGGTSSEQAYKNIPFYLSSRCYGLLVNDPGRVSFELASEVVTAVQFSVPGETLDYYLIAGDSPKDVLRNYAKLAGKPALPPAWSFGLWLTTSFTTDYDEKTVTGFIEGMAERDIPLHVFHFDCFWMKEYQWVDFEWDAEQFPDAPAMLARLKARGLKICVWINTYVAQKSRMFDEGMEKGYLVRKRDGSVWQWDRWQAGMGLVDFTNPEAAAWFQGKLRKLLDMGVDTFKTDFGERIPVEVIYADGSDPVKMHNYYTYLYNKAVFELLEEVKGKNEALVFARSATVGGQKFPVHWGGDCSATYESMAESLRGGLSLSLSGFGFWSHDISGFEKTATPDLFKRWTAFGLLSSHSRLHGSDSYRVPWNFDDEANGVLRFFVNLKCRLMPYLYAQACLTSAGGVPMMRAMVLEFPDDPACAYLDRQYLLGDSLLVAPVFSDDGTVSYYLPEGAWTNFLSGERVSGGRWLNEKHRYLSLPLMARANSIIAVGADDARPDYDYADGVVFHLFELEDGKTASTEVRGLDGRTETEVIAARKGGRITVKKTGNGKPWSVVFRGIRGASVVSGGTPARGGTGNTPQGFCLAATPGSGTMIIDLL
ncbi:MAG TPA: alpha-xylosidase [Treponema sp.]|nr:MAG: alpha-xylosidase [Treponema sp. GWC1_61_84]HCM28668.1 alpha-xylosidase [Treponema sp.]